LGLETFVLLVFKIADRAGSDIFLDQKANPEERKKRHQEHRKDDPAGGGNLPRHAREKLAGAARTVEIMADRRVRLLKRLEPGIGCRRLKISERLNAADRFVFRRFIVGKLKFVGFPRIRARRRLFVIDRRGRGLRLVKIRVVIIIPVGIMHRRHLCAAKAAKIARLRVCLTTILTMHHNFIFPALLNSFRA